jgi:hypothetical protein
MLNELQVSLISVAGSIVASVGISLLLFSLLPKRDNSLREDVKNLENRVNILEKK